MTHIINVLSFPFSKAIHLGWWLSVLRVFIDLLAKIMLPYSLKSSEHSSAYATEPASRLGTLSSITTNKPK